MDNFITDILENFIRLISVENPAGLLVIMTLAILADVGLPIPAIVEPTLFLLSYHAGPFSIPVLLFVAALHLGRQIGTAILYWPSRLLGGRFLGWVAGHLGGPGSKLAEQTMQFQEKLGKDSQHKIRVIGLITAGRLTPGLLPVVTLGSGILKLPYILLIIATVISGLAYDFTIIFLGYLAKLGLRGINPDIAAWATLAAIIVLASLPFLVSFVKSRRRNRKKRN